MLASCNQIFSILLIYLYVVPQREAALHEIVELKRKLNEFQANSLTQNHLHSVSTLEMKAKVSSTLIYCCLSMAAWLRCTEKAKQKTAVTMAQVFAQQKIVILL